MLSLENRSTSPNEVAVSAADLDPVGQPPLLSLVRQASPVQAPRRVEPPAPPEGDRAGSSLGDWLSAASRVGPCGVVICHSPEEALALLLLATRSAGRNPVEAAADSLGEATPCALPHAKSERSLLTLLFTDIVGSTGTVERLGDEAWQALLLEHHAIVRSRLKSFGGREVDHAGDGFFATFDQPSPAVRCAEAIRVALDAIGIVVRAGIHAGECQTVDGQVTGVAVHVAARISSIAQPGEILVSGSLKDLVAGAGLEFSDRQWHTLKGLCGRRQLFALGQSAVAPATTRRDLGKPFGSQAPRRSNSLAGKWRRRFVAERAPA